MFTSGFKLCLAHGIIALKSCPEYMKCGKNGDAGWLPGMVVIVKWRWLPKAGKKNENEHDICRVTTVVVAGHRYIQTGAPDVPGQTLRVFCIPAPFTGPEQHTVQQARWVRR